LPPPASAARPRVPLPLNHWQDEKADWQRDGSRKRFRDDPAAGQGRRHRHQDQLHTFRASGITAYLQNGGRLEVAQQMANHESARTTGLHDRRGDEISLDEVERITI